MWISQVCVLLVLCKDISWAGETGNSLVTCAACQTLQTQIDDWSCDINCRVANGNNGMYVTQKCIVSYLN